MIYGSGTVGIPSFVPLVGGIKLASGSVLLEFTNNDRYDDDYIAAWGQVPSWVLFWGDDPVGVQFSFDGEWSWLGAKEIEAIAPVTPLASVALTGFSIQSFSTSVTRGFLVPVGTPHLLLSGEWENAHSDVSIRLTAPDGTVYEEEDFAATGFIALVPEMTDEHHKTVALDVPAAGEWWVEAFSDGDLGEVSIGVLAGTTTPTVVITDVSHDPAAGTISVQYATHGGGDAATVGLFYTSSAEGTAGIRFATLGVPGDGDGVYEWDVSDLPPGDYYIYAIIEGEGIVPSVSGYSESFTILPDNDAPLAQDKDFQLDEGVAYAAVLPASDADGDDLTFELVDDPMYGLVVVNADGTFTYSAYRQPTEDFVGEDAFTFIANDGLAESNIGTMTVTISRVNDAPVLTSITMLTGAVEDTDYTIGYEELLAASDASDVDSDTIHFRIEQVASGTLTKDAQPVEPGITLLSPGESLLWRPPADTIGVLDALGVRAWDGLTASATAVTMKVRVDVKPSFIPFDMNWDGFVSIVGDVPAFVRVVYFGDYAWYEQQFPGKDPVLVGDCNCDGFLSIVGDVPGFVSRVYFDNDVMVYKPNIYLYPDESMDLDVSIGFPFGGQVTASYPAYEDGWHITAEPSGLIDGEHEYLFYESSQPDYGQYARGWVVGREDLEDFFRDNLASTGFVGREIDDFVDYWVPRLTESPYYAVYPQYNEQIEQAVTLEFSLQPDNVIRLVYAIRGLENDDLVLLEPVIPTFTRSGFTVTEWGVIRK